MSGATLKEGFLVKSPPLDRTLSSWRKRYFRLRESGHLDYYANEKKELSDKIDGINLGNCTGVEVLNQYDGKDFCIKVSMPDRVYIFKCATNEDMQDWYATIKRTYDSATGSTQVTIDASTAMGGSSPMPARPLPEINESPSSSSAAAAASPIARPLPTLPQPPEAGAAGNNRQSVHRPVAHSASFDETSSSNFKKARQDTAKPRMSSPEVTPLREADVTPPVPGKVPVLPPGHAPGQTDLSSTNRATARRKGGYTQIDFSAKQPKPPPPQPQQKRINYTTVEIGGKKSEPGQQSKSIAPPPNRINYTQVDFGASRSNQPPAQPSSSASSRTSYHHVDIGKTKGYRKSSFDQDPVAPPLPGEEPNYFDQTRDHAGSSASPYVTMQPPPPTGMPEDYEEMNTPAPPSGPPEEYEMMANPEPPQISNLPRPGPRPTARTERSLPGVPPATRAGQPVPPPRPPR